MDRPFFYLSLPVFGDGCKGRIFGEARLDGAFRGAVFPTRPRYTSTLPKRRGGVKKSYQRDYSGEAAGRILYF